MAVPVCLLCVVCVCMYVCTHPYNLINVCVCKGGGQQIISSERSDKDVQLQYKYPSAQSKRASASVHGWWRSSREKIRSKEATENTLTRGNR